MNDETDLQLLHTYAESRSEAAFTELVRRHVDFVYSAALRMVRDSHLAEDVTQEVFVAFAKIAAQLTNRRILSGWLHRTAQNIAAQTVRTIERRRAREQEVTAMNELLSADSGVVWDHIAPHLDEGLAELGDEDRDALFLRYFERKSAREMAQTLGTSEDAAQKRVSRAVERLREFFAKRGHIVGASGLVAVISSNAIQAAPMGLTATIAAAAVLAGTTIATTATASKAIAMTTLQKTLTIAIFAASLLICLLIQHQAQARLHETNQSLQRQADQLSRLKAENEHLSNIAAQAGSPDQSTELLRLRAKAGLLRGQVKDLAVLREENRRLQPPAREPQTILQSQEQSFAKQQCVEAWMRTFIAYAGQHQGQLPASFEQAEPFWPMEVKKATGNAADQFEILYHGSLDSLTNRNVIVFREKMPWQLFTGKWGKMYGMASGSAQYCSSSDKTPNGSFERFERGAAAIPTAQ